MNYLPLAAVAAFLLWIGREVITNLTIKSLRNTILKQDNEKSDTEFDSRLDSLKKVLDEASKKRIEDAQNYRNSNSGSSPDNDTTTKS